MSEGFLAYDPELDVWFYVLPTGDRMYRTLPDEDRMAEPPVQWRPVTPYRSAPPYVTDAKMDESGYRLSQSVPCGACRQPTLRWDTIACDYRHRHCRT